jgi:hypothetical protein
MEYNLNNLFYASKGFSFTTGEQYRKYNFKEIKCQHI